MKKMKHTTITISLITLMILAGCSSRVETPVVTAGSTITYPAKKAGDISANITFCRKLNKVDGGQIGAGTVFSIMENAKVYAVVDLENHFNLIDRDLMFHLDWIGPNGRSFYRKQINLSPGDTATVINSSVSISPEKRQAGEYSFRVYYFRELIAEKKFELLPELIITPSMAEELAPHITLYRKTSKKTGKLIGEGTIFTIKKKRRVRALINLGNRFAFNNSDLIFHLDWIGPDGKSVYRKQIGLYPDDSTSTIKSSISIDKKLPGKYSFQLFLSGQLIAEKEFELQDH